MRTQRGTHQRIENEKVENVCDYREHTEMHDVANERAKRQHIDRSDDERKIRGGVSGCRCSNVRIMLIPSMRCVA